MLHVTERCIENHGVVVGSDYLFYCFIDRLVHERVIVAVAELAYDQSADVGEHTAHLQIAHHPVDVIMPLADVFDQQNGFC